MKLMSNGLLVILASFTWATAAYASDDTSSPLDHDRIEIRSMQDPSVTILKSQPVSVILPGNPTIADKQLLQLIKNNLIAQGYTVTSPDKSMWTITGTAKDESSMLTYSKLSGILFLSPTTSTSTVSYANITVVICANSDLSSPVWSSSVLALNDFWVNNQESIIKAILATYGVDFYYRNEDPKDVLNDATKKKYRPTPPTLEDIKHCDANPKADGCS
jgi:hypothetical protein